MMEDQYSRTRMMIGEDGLQILAASHVAILGLGGVGSLPPNPWLVVVWESDPG